jgi:hypothetical protein
MHEAETVVGHHVGLPLAPPRQGGGPLPSPAQLVDALTEGDRVAVHDAGDNRRQLSRGDSHHGFVHKPQAVLRAPLSDQRVALLHQAHRDQVLVTEALADLGDLDCGRVRGLVITAEHVFQQGCDQHVSALDTVTPLAPEQPPCSSEPSLRGPCLPPEQEVVPDPPRAAHGGQRLA